MRTLGQSEDEERAPLVAYPVKHIADRAVPRQTLFLLVGLQGRPDSVPDLSRLALGPATRFRWFLQGNYLPKNCLLSQFHADLYLIPGLILRLPCTTDSEDLDMPSPNLLVTG